MGTWDYVQAGAMPGQKAPAFLVSLHFYRMNTALTHFEHHLPK